MYNIKELGTGPGDDARYHVRSTHMYREYFKNDAHNLYPQLQAPLSLFHFFFLVCIEMIIIGEPGDKAT